MLRLEKGAAAEDIKKSLQVHHKNDVFIIFQFQNYFKEQDFFKSKQKINK